MTFYTPERRDNGQALSTKRQNKKSACKTLQSSSALAANRLRKSSEKAFHSQLPQNKPSSKHACKKSFKNWRKLVKTLQDGVTPLPHPPHHGLENQYCELALPKATPIKCMSVSNNTDTLALFSRKPGGELPLFFTPSLTLFEASRGTICFTHCHRPSHGWQCVNHELGSVLTS